MKVFVILESYTNGDGGNATSFGVFKTKEEAIKNLPKAILERFDYESIEEFNDDCDESFMKMMSSDKTHWCWDRDDDIIEFYIQEDELKD